MPGLVILASPATTHPTGATPIALARIFLTDERMRFRWLRERCVNPQADAFLGASGQSVRFFKLETTRLEISQDAKNEYIFST